ncbi:transcriptional regulator [Candidatus Methylospira mobilis]|uniref:Transcriptional regulator n=1 Tax=Candidatus Methylospira mobilis TaxID=1808979 RepID=A0A5Q0BJV1_9GAMM|nr:transcriptional regulator [Candidatus Methylospira mobilis]QFY44090.1 transcriptional regulator [Candidatus Methylospira mobilis]WNV06508.1 hypothetical protein RP726_08910 [Candidatus Methylospira mobilis]
MRIATIHIRKANDVLEAARSGFLSAWNTGEYTEEHFGFASPAALFRVLTPRRWDLIECLQKSGPLSGRALARALGRDIRRVHDDVKVVVQYGLVEKVDNGKLHVPFNEVHADFVMKSAA